MFHFFIELTSARYGARASALAPQPHFNKPIYYGLIKLQCTPPFQTNVHASALLEFPTGYEPKDSSTPLYNRDGMHGQMSFLSSSLRARANKKCPLHRRSVKFGRRCHNGVPRGGTHRGYPSQSSLKSSTKHQAASSQSCLDKLL